MSSNQVQNQPVENDVNQDLLRLRQMNQAFTKMNYQHIHDNNEYYSYYLQETSSLSICQGQQHGQQESLIYYGENGQNTQRSNSLLFALSEKDDDDTRPTTNLNHFHFEPHKYHDLQTQNQNKFEQFQYDPNQSLPVNNTIFEEKNLQKNVFNNLNCPKVHQSRYYQSRLLSVQNQKKEENQIQGFSKYAQFAIKISKLFNVQVEDLEIIYNQLQAEKQNQKQEASSQGLASKGQVTDSEVMKKLFDYALKIKNSHHRLMDIITTIDSRISKRPKTSQNTVAQTQMENVSLNFLLEEQLSRAQLNNHHQKHQGNEQIKRLSKNTIIFPQQDNFNLEQNQTLQSKNTIFRKLESPQSPTFQVNSGQTIQSFNSMVYSQKTQTKSHKLKMKSKVTEKIKLISEQLESLKQQIDRDDQCEEEQNVSKIKQKQHCQPYQLHAFSEIKEKPSSDLLNRQKVKTSPFYIERPISSIQKDQSTEQKKPLTNLTQTRESQPYPFGRQSFTYLKSANEITEEDSQIDRKIQQTVKTCIVKSSSKKSQVSQQKQNQKIIVEPVPAQTSNQKYSFKSQSFQPSESPNIDIKVQNRQKMFRSIVQIRKSFSKDKKTFKDSPIKTEVKKTSNIAYLEDEQNNQKQKITVKQNLNEQKPFAKKSSIVEKSFQKTNVVSNHSFHEEKTNIGTKKLINNAYEIESAPVQQINVISQKTPHFLSTKNIQFINQNNQSVTTQQHELPTQRINYPRNYSQVSLKRESSQEKIKIFQPIRYLESAKTVQSRPFIESEKFIQKNFANEPKLIYHPNNIFNSPPRIISGDQKISITVSPKNAASFHPHYFQTNQNSTQTFRPPSLQRISISRPVTQIVKSQNFGPQNLTQRSSSTQRLQQNDNTSPRYVYIPRANNFFEVRKNDQQFTNQSFNNNNPLLTNRPNEVRSITQRQLSSSVEKRQTVPMRILTPQKINLEALKQTLVEKTINSRFKKCLNVILSRQPEIIKRNVTDNSETQTPCFSERTYIQSQRQAMIESIKPSILKNTGTLRESIKEVEPKLQQSFMYYGPINPALEKTLQQSNLITFRKEQSVVRTFPIQHYQSQKMSNSVYARQEVPEINSAQSNSIYRLKPLNQQNNSEEKKPLNFPQTPRIPKNLRPPKYVPPKQADIHQQKFFDTHKYNKTLQESKPLQIMDESKKSHIAINASSVKSPQYDLQDSPSFGVFNEQSYANTFFVSPSRPLSSEVDSRDSSESKRSAVSSRSKSGKKGIALQSKRTKSPRHTFVQSSYMP